MLPRSLVVAFCLGSACSTPPSPRAVSASARATASAAPSGGPAFTPAPPPPQPTRTYAADGAAILVPGAADGMSEYGAVYALSPDGLIVAVLTVSESAVLFYDVDRRMVVGRAPAPGGMVGDKTFRWLSDDRLLLRSAYGTTGLYDGRRGLLLGEPRALVGAVEAAHRVLGAELVEGPEGASTARILDLAAPAEPVATVPSTGRSVMLFTLGRGRVALADDSAMVALDERGAALWRVAGSVSAGAAIPGTSAVFFQRDARVVIADRETGEVWVEIEAVLGAPASEGVVAVRGSDVVFLPAARDAVPHVVVEGASDFVVSANGAVVVARRSIGALVRAELPKGPARVVTTTRTTAFAVSDAGRYVSYLAGDERHIADFASDPQGDALVPDGCEPRFASNDAPRLLACEDGLRVAPRDPLGPPEPKVALVARRREYAPLPSLVHGGAKGLIAKCSNGASARFGLPPDPVDAVRASATKDMGEPSVAWGGDTLVAADGRAPEAGVDVWDIPSSTKRAHIALLEGETASGATRLVVSRDGATIATGRQIAQSVDLWRATDGAHLFTLPVAQYVQHFAFHPNGKSIVVSDHWPVGGAYLESDTMVRIFELATGTKTNELAGSAFRFSEDGTKLTVSSYGAASVVDASSYRTLRSWTGEGMGVTLSPRATFALVPTTYTGAAHPGMYYTSGLRLIDLATGAERAAIAGIPGAIAWSSDDAQLVVARATHWDAGLGGRALDVGLYDARRGREVRRLAFPLGVDDPRFVASDAVLSVWAGDHRVFHSLKGDRESLGWIVERDSACATFVTDAEMTVFDGDPAGGMCVRLGVDLRTAPCATGELLEERRRPELLGW